MMRVQLLLLILIGALSVGSAQGDEPPILILGAVPQEITYLVEQLEAAQQDQLSGVPYWRGRLQDKPVVIAITGVGKTFTAMTTTLFATHFTPAVAVMTGTGARINPALRTGDVIIPSKLHFHDFGSLGPTGMIFRDMKSPDGGKPVPNVFSPAPAMLAMANLAIADYPPQTVNIGENEYQNRVRPGVVTTSDLFGVTNQRIEQLRNTFDTDIMEMESAAFALVCQRLGIDYLVVRAGSNQAQEAPNDDYLVLGPIAADQAARFTYHLVGKL